MTSFLAQHTDRCQLCQETIHVGDEVEYLEGQIVHSDCADDWHDEDV